MQTTRTHTLTDSIILWQTSIPINSWTLKNRSDPLIWIMQGASPFHCLSCNSGLWYCHGQRVRNPKLLWCFKNMTILHDIQQTRGQWCGVCLCLALTGETCHEVSQFWPQQNLLTAHGKDYQICHKHGGLCIIRVCEWYILRLFVTEGSNLQ